MSWKSCGRGTTAVRRAPPRWMLAIWKWWRCANERMGMEFLRREGGMAQANLAQWQQQGRAKEEAKEQTKTQTKTQVKTETKTEVKEEIEMKGGRYTRIFVDEMRPDDMVLPGEQGSDLEPVKMELWFGVLRSVTFL